MNQIPPDLELSFVGVPATAGNKSAFPFIRGYRHNGKPILGARIVEGGKNKASARKSQQWRDAVAAVVLERVLGTSPRPVPLDGPLFCWADFYLPRPKTVRAPWPTAKPDWSKLLRAVEDPIVRPAKGYPGLIHDDARIVFAMGGKFFADDRRPGADVRIWRITAGPDVFAPAIGGAIERLWIGSIWAVPQPELLSDQGV
jgi:Holliday junction resolvase RusA-like endonuclease